MMSFEVSLEHFVLLPQITQGKANVLTDHPSLGALLGIPYTFVLQQSYSSTLGMKAVLPSLQSPKKSQQILPVLPFDLSITITVSIIGTLIDIQI